MQKDRGKKTYNQEGRRKQPYIQEYNGSISYRWIYRTKYTYIQGDRGM